MEMLTEVVFLVVTVLSLMAFMWMAIGVQVTGYPYRLIYSKKAIAVLDDLVARVLLEEMGPSDAVDRFRETVGARYLAFSPRYIDEIYRAADKVSGAKLQSLTQHFGQLN
jgi:Zn-dependent protease